MTTYPLLTNAKVVTAVPSPSRPPSLVAAPGGGAGTQVNITTGQTFHYVLTGIGTVSATVNVVVSNDGVNWLDLNPVSLSGPAPQQNYLLGVNPWAYFAAYVSAISGTGATVNLTMSA